jgi:hypothetical protein
MNICYTKITFFCTENIILYYLNTFYKKVRYLTPIYFTYYISAHNKRVQHVYVSGSDLGGQGVSLPTVNIC